MEEQAMFVEFTADEDRDPTLSSFQAVLDYSYHGKEPPLTDGKLTIFDSAKIFPRILKGCKGKAVWDDINKVYEAYEAQQQALIIRGIATADACSDSERISFSGVAAMSHSPFGALPETPPDDAANIGLAVQSGDVVIAAWDEDDEDWRVVNVEHKEQVLVTARRFNNGCWEYKTRKCAVSSCENESDWQQEICGDPCE